MNTLFHMNVERSRKRPARLAPEAEALAALKARLPDEAVALQVADWPGILICHRGKLFGLSVKLPGISMTMAQANAVIGARASGLRVEVAQGAEQAVARAHEMCRAAERHAAARAFDEGWQLCAASWPGSSGFERISHGGGGTPGAFADRQRDVKDYWRQVEQAMGANDWLIVRRVCGENYTVAQAVSAISPAYKFSTLARFREALDGLVGARAAVGRRIACGG